MSEGWSSTSAGDRAAAWLTRRLSSMGAVYATVALSAVWMVLGAGTALGFDPYPYPVLLFAGNVVQLLLIFVILVGQRILSAGGERRAQQTYDDTQAILGECRRLQALIDDQARLLNRSTPAKAQLDPCDTAPIMIAAPESEHPSANSLNRRIAAWLVTRLGSPSAIVAATVITVVWMLLGQLGVIPDPYPFPFMTFCSSLAQLVFMFVIMVGQDVLGESSERRVVETANHTAVVLQQCRHLRQHLITQDTVLAALLDRAPAGFPTQSVGADHDHATELRTERP